MVTDNTREGKKEHGPKGIIGLKHSQRSWYRSLFHHPAHANMCFHHGMFGIAIKDADLEAYLSIHHGNKCLVAKDGLDTASLTSAKSIVDKRDEKGVEKH